MSPTTLPSAIVMPEQIETGNSLWYDAWSRLRKNRLAVCGGADAVHAGGDGGGQVGGVHGGVADSRDGGIVADSACNVMSAAGCRRPERPGARKRPAAG
mgnify:CR=1 FL=1